MNGKMILFPAEFKQISHDLCSRKGCEIAWVGENGDRRTPQEKTVKVPHLGFLAAGKAYVNWKKLCVKESDREDIYYDVYGREVLCIFELFPCFDSYDYLYEDRYYRWFFIKEDGKLTRIYCADQRGTIQVTEDVQNLENKCREQMQKLNWI